GAGCLSPESQAVEKRLRPARYPPSVNHHPLRLRFSGWNQRGYIRLASDSPRSGRAAPPGNRVPSGVACVRSSAHPIPSGMVETGMSLISFSEQTRMNPLDVVERVAASNGWSFERAGEDEITILVTGKWTDYQVSYTWMYDIEALHLACAFELKVPERNRSEVQQLISMINEQLWVGHFDLWTQDGLVMY